jgi:hypothetical protein
MVLAPRLDSLDGLSEDEARHYEQQPNGGFRLAVKEEDGWALENIAGIKSAYAKKDKELRELKAKAEAFGDMDPDAAKDALTKVTEMADWTPGEKVAERLETIKRQLSEEYGKTISKRDAEIEKFRAQVTKLVKTNQIRDALVQNHAKTGKALDALMALLDTRVRVDFTTDTPQAQVMGPDGETPLFSTATGEPVPMSIAEHVGNLRNDGDYAAFFEASGASGGGSETPDALATATQRGSTTTVRWSDSDAISENLEGIAEGTVRVVR